MDRTVSSPPTSQRSSARRCSSGTACETGRLFAVSLLTLFTLFASGTARAQDSEAEQRAREIEAVCSKAHCREARTVSVRLEDGSTFERAIPRLPIVLPNGWITLFPGEEVHIELTIARDAIRSARAVAKPVRRNATVTFKLSQQPGRAETLLAVTHALPQNLKYSMGMMLPTGGQFATPSCPVAPGVTTHETWPHPVFQLVIRDLRFLPEGAPLTCER